MPEKIYDVIVIGGGPAGYTAALYCARSGLSVLVLEKLSPGGQTAETDKVDNYPGFPEGIGGFALGERIQRGALRFGAENEFREVTSADLKASVKQITAGTKTWQAKAVVIATGAYPRKLGLEGEEQLRGRGVSYCAVCDGMFYKGKTAAVAGGGYSAVEDALHLSKLCKKVYLIHRRDALRAPGIYEKALQESGVEILWNSRIEELLYEEQLTGVRLTDTQTGEPRELSCDGLFVAVGRVPATELFRGQLSMDEAGYIEADETTCTGLPGVFAAGDVRTKPLRQIVTAAADGAVAAHGAEQYLAGQKQ